MDRKEGSAEGGGRSDGQKWMQMSCVRGCIDYLQAARSFRRGIETPFAAPTARHRSPTLFCFGSDQKNQNPTKVVSPSSHQLIPWDCFERVLVCACFQERVGVASGRGASDG